MLAQTFALLSLIAAIDMRTFRIPYILVFPLFITALVWHGFDYIGSSVLLGVFGMVAHYVPSKPYIGRGDIILLSITGLFIPLELLNIFCLAVGGVGILYASSMHHYKKVRYFPFAPAICFGLIVVILLAD